jgi:hypothetical protein
MPGEADKDGFRSYSLSILIEPDNLRVRVMFSSTLVRQYVRFYQHRQAIYRRHGTASHAFRTAERTVDRS